ncbi:MAG: ribosome maturation factor RimP [Candidatus Zixiibacteriota bacterium]
MALKDDIIELVTPLLESENFDLVEIKLSQYKRNSRVQLFVDSDKGVSIEDCIRLTKLLEPHLEASNFFEYGYIVEISSPGLDRPLKTARDFKRRVGEKIRLLFVDDMFPAIEGELTDSDESSIELTIEDKKERFNINQIQSGKIIF